MRTVALPIENKVREFDGKLWLGLNFVERGYGIVLGPSWEIKPTIDLIQPDVYFSKDPGDGNMSFFEDLQASNICVCGISPEAALNTKTEYHAANKQKIIKALDAYFAWGTEPANELKKNYEDITAEMHITGNPRFDLLTKGLESVYVASGKEIHDAYGDFILMNTNFGEGNPMNREEMFKLVRKHTPERDLLREERLSLRLLYLFLDLVLYLSDENTGHDIIIRPHPGEDHSTYERLFSRYENVHVKHEGDVRSWIHAADGVIHHDCTTGIEAALMGTPVVSYQPLSDVETDSILSQAVSRIETTRSGVKDWIDTSTTGGNQYQLSESQQARLRRYFPNMDKSAAPQICEAVDTLLADSHMFTEYNINTQQQIERRIKASQFGTSVLNLYDYGRDMMTGSEHRKSRAKLRQKFSGLERAELSQRTDEMMALMNISDVTIEPIPLTNYTYRIKPTA